LVVLRRQGADLGGDAEESGQEIFEMRRNGDEQFRFRLAAERLGLGTGRRQARRQVSIGGGQVLAERSGGVGQAGGTVEVGEAQSVGKRKFGHRNREGRLLGQLLCAAKSPVLKP